MSKEDLKKQERIDLVVGQSAPSQQDEGDDAISSDTRSAIDRSNKENTEDTFLGNETMVLDDEHSTETELNKSSGFKSNSIEHAQAKSASGDDLVGQTIAGRFEIIAKLGEGGMSVVYKARHLLLNRIVAIKFVKQGVMQTKAAMRFQQEAKAATSLNHENIATVREFGYDENGAYLVMDFVDGVPLNEAIKNELIFSEERAKNIISQVCEGLKHAHQAGVIHRDLKPANIILSRNANGEEIPKIVDFGIAKFVDEENQANLTQTGEVFGTPNYMSPEQCLGKRADSRSDIYSLGCVAYECLTGKPPFVADSALEILMKHSKEQFVKPKHHSAKTLMNAIQGCLEKDPNDRWQSADDLRQFIQNPDGPAKKKYKKLEKHFTPAQIVKISLTSSALIIAASFIMQVAPVAISLIAPSPWNQLVRSAEGNIANGPANYRIAEVELKKALKAAKEGHASDIEVEYIYTQLAHVQSNMNKWEASKKSFANALALNEKHSEDFGRGSIHDWLSEIYLNEKNYPKAIAEAKTADEIKARVVGYGNRLALLPLFRLGQAYRGNKELQEAEKVDRKLVSLVEKLYPTKGNLMVSDAYKQLANILYQQGKFPEALTYYQQEVSVLASVLGKENPVTVDRARDVYWKIKRKGSDDAAQLFWKKYGTNAEKDE